MAKIKQIKVIKVVQRLLGILVLVVGLGGCAKYFPTTITLKDGTAIEGNTSTIIDYRFKFQDAKTGEKKFLYSEDIKSIKKTFPDKVVEYENVICEIDKKRGRMRRLLLQVEIRGEVNLFSYSTIKPGMGSSNPAQPGGGNTFNTYSDKSWYMQKTNGKCILYPFIIPNTPINLIFDTPTKKKFREFAQNFFSDSPEIMDKINQKGYGHHDFIKIIKEYNQIISKQ